MFWNLLSWYVIILIVGWLTFPLAYRLLAKLPDRGYTLSRALGLLLWVFIFWLLCSFGILQNTPGGILFALVIVLALSLWAGWGKWKEIWKWLSESRRLILTAEVVFLVGFMFMTLVRASDPDATGTEKPMELAFINAILNSKTFPPHDPWLSGYAISYYHFGYILAAMLAKITFTAGGVAFNLMLISVFAMIALGAYGVLVNLLIPFNSDREWGSNALGWGLFGPVFLLFISNLEGVLEVLHQIGVGWDLENGTSRFWEWIHIESLLLPPSQPLTLMPQRFWWWWQASRVIQDIDLVGNVSGLSPIDEFPAFSFVLGDLHPHVLVMPFVMLAVGLALNVFLGGMDDDKKVLGFRLPYRWDSFLVSAVLLGGIAFLNTWDLPVYFALVVGAFTIRQVMQKGWDWERLGELLKLAIPLGLLSLILYLPFFISFQSQAGGLLPNLIYPTRGLYLWLMFGTLFVPIFLLFSWLRRQNAESNWGRGSEISLFIIGVLMIMSILLGFRMAGTDTGQALIASQGETSFLGLLLSALSHRLRYGVTLLTLGALLVIGISYLLGWITPKAGEDGAMRVMPFVLLMVVLGGLMVLTPEFVYLQDNFGARMNTIFKFYYQAWMLWSLSAGFAAVVLISRGSWLSKALVLIFILLGLVYPILAFPTKTANFHPTNGYTLDAGSYMEAYQPDEAAAIKWLSEAEDGVVAEAVGGQYSSFARVATHSGQPTVLGWPGHEGQWRGGYTEVGNREGDIRTLYETPSWETALEIIRRYDIRYIYIGSLEESTYAVNPVKFEQNLQVGFEGDGVLVYVVPPILQEADDDF
jgi:YYY domain-containing protein